MPTPGLVRTLLIMIVGMLLWVPGARAQDTSATLAGAPGVDPLAGRLMRDLAEAKLGSKTRLAVYVCDPRTGVEFVDLNSTQPMRPASLMKLLTAAVALDLLGPDRTFETVVKTLGTVEGNVLDGDVVIVGGGDPSLGPRFSANPNDVTARIREWAQAIHGRGIRRIEGNILGDDRRYENEPVAIGWDRMELGEWYSAEVSPLCFNDNCIDVLWSAGGKQGARAEYKLIPDTTYARLASSVRTGAPGQKSARLRYFRFADGNEIRARGSIPPNTRKYDYAAIHDPATYTATLLFEELKRKGVVVTGNAFNRRDIEGEDSATSETLVLATVKSPSLGEMLPVMLGDSQNLYAEVFARETALAAGQPASFLGAGRAIGLWLREKGLHRNGLAMVDGSGLSTVNRAPARLFADVLRHEANGPNGELFRSSLATPGTRSLKNRFRGEDSAGLRDGLLAKTGYIDASHTLAGFFRHRNGAEYLFVIMVNDYDPERSAEAREFVDRTVMLLHRSEVLP